MKGITLITGGCSGLGLELAKIAIKTNDIAIIGHSADKANNARKLLKDIKACDCFTYFGELGDINFVEKVFSDLEAKGYYVNNLFNCAGRGYASNPKDITATEWDKIVSANLTSTIYCCSKALKNMEVYGGTIVNILSTAALKGNPEETLYCATKWGAKGYTEALKAYYKGNDKVKIVEVCPGGMATPFWRKDYGKTPNLSTFMDAKEVANTIWDTIFNKKTLRVTNLIIERNV